METVKTTSKVPVEEGLLGFHASYRSVDWNRLLSHAQKSLTIVVYYWDQWTQEHLHALTDFIKKTDTVVRFIFADDSNPGVLSEIERLFPKHPGTVLQDKIRRTYLPLQEVVLQQRLPASKIQIYKLPHLLNYSMQCIDDKILVLSFFEMYRQEQVDSPVIIVDLHKSEHLHSFYTKELRGIIAAK